jgi:TolB-like protein
MALKKHTALMLAGLLQAAAAFAQTRMAEPNDPNAAPKAGQSEIILNAENCDRDIAVWVNGEIAAHVLPRTREKIIVSNGRNIIEAADTTLSRGQWKPGGKKQAVVDANSNAFIIGLTTRYGRLLNLAVEQTITGPLVENRTEAVRGAPSPGRAGGALDSAVNRAVEALLADIPNGSTVAVLSIASNDRDQAEFILDELTFLIVDTKRFKVVDRKSLDLLRTEHQFQFSGDVDDSSAVSIGKMLGASIVLTGSVSGSGETRRLRVKVLDVKTAEIKAMASERF